MTETRTVHYGRWTAAASTVAVIVSLATVPASAAPADPLLANPDVTPAMVTAAGDSTTLAAIARDLELTPTQVIERRSRTATARSIRQALETRLGARYGGWWLNTDATQLTVAVTDASLMRQVRAAGAKPMLVKRSEAELAAIMKRLDATVTSRNSVDVWYVSAATNTVVAETSDEAGTRAWIAASGVPADAVSLRPSAGKPVVAGPVRGGTKVGAACTVGFGAEFFGIRGYFTAGHCSPDGARVTTANGDSGTVMFSVFPGPDYAFVRLDDQSAATATINTGRETGVIGVEGAGQAVRGDLVCRAGPAEEEQCGNVLDTGVSTNVTDMQGTVLGSVIGMTRTGACGLFGDSGGPFYTEQGIALGVLSASTSTACRGRNRNGNTFYQPLSGIPGDVLTLDSPSASLRIIDFSCWATVYDPSTIECDVRWAGGVDPAQAVWTPRPFFREVQDPVARTSHIETQCGPFVFVHGPDPDGNVNYWTHLPATISVTVTDAVGNADSASATVTCINAGW